MLKCNKNIKQYKLNVRILKQTNKIVITNILKILYFIQVKEKIFRRQSSNSETGTTQWSMNVSHMANAKKGPKKSFNAYKEFRCRVRCSDCRGNYNTLWNEQYKW